MNRALPILSMLMLVAYAFRRLLMWNPFGSIDLSANILVAAAILGVMGALAASHRIAWPGQLWGIGFSLLGFVALGAFQLIQSPDPVRGMTMFLLLLLNMAAFVAFLQIRSSDDVRRIAKYIIIGSVISAGVSLVAYMEAVSRLDSIRASRELWKPEYIYEFTHARFLQFEGYTGDPNFVGTIFFLPLVLIIWKQCRSANLAVTLLTITPIGLCLVLSMSRGMVAAIVVSSLVMALVCYTVNSPDAKRYMRGIICYLFVLPLLAALILLSSFDLNAVTDGLDRFDYAPTSRLGNWSSAWNLIVMSPVLGNGLRSGEMLLSGHYLENSYLDLLLEYGLFGFVLVLSVVGTAFLRGVSQAHRVPELIPWLHVMVFFGLQMIYRSMLYNFLFWIVVAIVLALAVQKIDEVSVKCNRLNDVPRRA